MAQVALTNAPGVFADIDECDVDLMAGFSWFRSTSKRGGDYAVTNIQTADGWRSIGMHRMIMGLAPGDSRRVDHIDGNGRNNKRSNLRLCTAAQNQWNRGPGKGSASGMKGVMFEKCGRNSKSRRWRATVVACGVRHRQYFNTPEEADAWAKAKREELHGEFANNGRRLGVNTDTKPADEAR